MYVVAATVEYALQTVDVANQNTFRLAPLGRATRAPGCRSVQYVPIALNQIGPGESVKVKSVAHFFPSKLSSAFLALYCHPAYISKTITLEILQTIAFCEPIRDPFSFSSSAIAAAYIFCLLSHFCRFMF